MIQSIARDCPVDGTLPELVYLAPFDVLSRNGGAARVLGLAEALAGFYQVSVVSLVGSGRQPLALPLAPNARIYFAPVPKVLELAVEKNRKVYGGAAYSLTLAESWPLLDIASYWVSSLLSRARVLLLNQPYLWPLAQHFRGPKTVLVYDVPEVNRFFTLRFAGPQADQARVTTLQAELEGATCREAHIIAMASQMDSEVLCKEQGGSIQQKLRIVPNGVWVDRGTYCPAPQKQRLKRCCGLESFLTVFLGSPGYGPNLDAVEYIINTLAPAHPDHRFVVIGMGADDRTADGLVPGNVHFVGRVSEDVKSAILAMSDLALAPMQYDSGSSLKIPDYISHGTPVVATPHGLRGFEALTSLAVVAERSAFAAAYQETAARIQVQPLEVEKWIGEMKAVVKKHYDWSVIGAAYAEAIPTNSQMESSPS